MINRGSRELTAAAASKTTLRSAGLEREIRCNRSAIAPAPLGFIERRVSAADQLGKPTVAGGSCGIPKTHCDSDPFATLLDRQRSDSQSHSIRNRKCVGPCDVSQQQHKLIASRRMV